MKRRHNMPFGAECRDGSVRFRLWAPAARQVELSLAGANRSMRLPLDPCDPYSVERGESLRIRRAASIPFNVGSPRSSTIKSGWSSSAF